MSGNQGHGTRGLVQLAGLDADQAVLDEVDAADALFLRSTANRDSIRSPSCKILSDTKRPPLFKSRNTSGKK